MAVLEPGTPVDIFTAADQPSGRWVWTTGYIISTSKKERHKKLGMMCGGNPLTKEIEPYYAVQRGARVFPVCRSHVRPTNPVNQDVWEYPKINATSVALPGFVVADESDRADLLELSDFEPVSEVE